MFYIKQTSRIFSADKQTSDKQTRRFAPSVERSLAYAKTTQTSGKRACSQFPERSLAYAKIAIIYEQINHYR